MLLQYFYNDVLHRIRCYNNVIVYIEAPVSNKVTLQNMGKIDQHQTTTKH